MAKKKKAEEHENLERWLVSYSDFMTLLFATFVVLYALSQIDIDSYENLQKSIREAFAAPSLLEGSDGILSSSSSSILDPTGATADSMIPPVLEYLNAKYEEKAFQEIQKDIEEMTKAGEMEGIEATIEDRGLHITLKNSDLFFRSGEAKLRPSTYDSLQKVSALIKKKFNRHLVRIEGHTDDLPIQSEIYPSNWELSSARACAVARYLISSKNLDSSLISAIGYAENKPLVPNDSQENRKKNRRVEIIILKNQFVRSEPKGAETIKPPSEDEKRIKEKEAIKTSTSSAVEALLDGVPKDQNVLIIKDSYQEARARALQNLQQKENAFIQSNPKI